MNTPALLVQLRTEIEQFGQLADATLPDSSRKPVPACEGMVLGELVRHVGSVHRVASQWVREGRRPTTWATAPEAGDNLAAWARRGGADLLETLTRRHPAQQCSTWSATDRTVGFWIRRMAHETAMHRVDACQAVDAPWSVNPQLATDGVAEALELWLGTRLGSQVGGSGRAVRLVASAGLGTKVVDWTVRPLMTLVEFGGDPAGADVTVTGAPAALWAWTWGRSDKDHPVNVVGDKGAADELRELLGRAQL
ncbi:MAG: maleylpyruvate isomerase family mycothiol-dependent enzyme [Kineosporiaceae bacterium]|nr:maleylpyruvate isomerase family mycothiol-dependent enzyme [Aeromicrobium sp.]